MSYQPPAKPPSNDNFLSGLLRQGGAIRIAKQILVIGWPLIVTHCAGVLMQVTDALFVAELGEDYLAAISPAYLMALLPISLGLGIVSTTSTFVSQSWGANRRHEGLDYAAAGLWISAFIGLLVLLLIPTAPFAFGILNHEIEVFELEVSYFQVTLCGVGLQMASMTMAGYFIGIHRTSIAMTGTIVATLSNIFFDYAFIFGKFGFPELGFDGAAWGTVAASGIHLLFMAFFLVEEWRGETTRFLHTFRFAPARILTMLRVGTPYGLQSALEVLATGGVLIWLIGLFGKAHLAAATIVIRCAMISHIPPEGIASGLTALVGKSIGQQRHLLAELQVKVAFRIVAGYISVIALGFILLRNGLAGLFSTDPEVIGIAATALVYVACFQILDTMSIVYNSALQAAGDTFWPMIANAVLCAVVFIGGGLFMVKFFPSLGSLGIWLVDGLYVVAQGLAFRYRWRSAVWKDIVLIDGLPMIETASGPHLISREAPKA